jgi:SAM-dependent methyltransferase
MSYFYLLDGFLHAYIEGEVLDVGYGRGIAYRYATRIVGVDVHLPSLKRARKVCEDVVYADARYLPFKDESFDTVVAVEVIEHMAKRDGYRLLYSDGKSEPPQDYPLNPKPLSSLEATGGTPTT